MRRGPLALVVAGAVITTFTVTTMIVWHTGTLLSLLLWFMFAVIGGLSVMGVFQYIGGDNDAQMAGFIFTTALLWFFASWLIVPASGEFAILQRGQETTLSGARFIVPYGYQISYIQDMSVSGMLSLERDGNEIRWDAKADLDFVASYEDAFNLLRRFGDKKGWVAAVQRVFDEAVSQRAAAFTPDEKLPSRFSFTFTQEQTERLAQLGFKAKGEITSENIRLVKR